MKFICLPLLFITALQIGAQDRYTLPLAPLDFNYDAGDFFIPSVNQMETDGNHLYLRALNHTEILVLDQEGRLVHILGGKGGHPREFGEVGVMAFSLQGDWLWGIDAEAKRVRGFFKKKHQVDFALDSFNVRFKLPTSNVFAASENYVVVPAHPRTGHLAAVYDMSGELVKWAGKLMPFGEERTFANRGANDTFWLRGNGVWLSIHKFFPLITLYDEYFTVVKELRVSSPIIDKTHERIASFTPSARMKEAPPLFTDAKIHADRLYLMSSGHLHQVELDKGEVLSITRFQGKGPDFAGVTRPWVTLFFFAILDNGTVVLGHPSMPWNHDLWTARLPYLETRANATR